jgi:hypothetical protein
MSAFDSATSVQDQILATVKTAEDAVLSAAKTIVDSVEPLAGRIPSAPFSDKLPSATELVDNTFGFAQKVLANQKAFYTELAKVFTSNGKA